MTELKFQGPFHFDDIDPKTGKIENDGDSFDLLQRGIYIWGFMYEYNEKTHKLGKPVKSSIENKTYKQGEMQFIPYYVGKADKTTIHLRLNDHHNLKKATTRKYMRFSEKYMTMFSKDPLFPIKMKRKENKSQALKLCRPKDSPIEYFNDEACLKNIYPNIQISFKDGYPIDLQKNGEKDLPDTLQLLIDKDKLNNFWFCFAIIPNTSEFTAETLETYVYWSLKGFTISETGPCPTPNSSITIEHNNDYLRVFNKDDNGRICPNNDFLGY